ncbi:MAG: acetyl-CoA carboxylase biotin carboxyl carrier protein, partial [Verrucomicrobiales bacterium]
SASERVNQEPEEEEETLEFKEIKQIVELMNKHELSYFHLERGDFCLELKKGLDMEAVQELLASTRTAPAGYAMPMHPGGGLPGGGAPALAPVDPDAGTDTINAPMVGTYYRSASPESEPFVKVGQVVDENTTICVIEAMKTFNEIKAEKRGTILKICVENAQPVQYDDPLFVIKPA